VYAARERATLAWARRRLGSKGFTAKVMLAIGHIAIDVVIHGAADRTRQRDVESKVKPKSNARVPPRSNDLDLTYDPSSCSRPRLDIRGLRVSCDAGP
jgi:hypothetical protein